MPFHVYNVMPIPPDPARTRYVEAGAIRVGVEYRNLDAQELEAAYGDDPQSAAEIDAALPADGVDDEGVSLHVEGEDGREYLRFDIFKAGPHYHYIRHDAGENIVVDFDPVALGEMLPWALQQLRTRLAPMLEQAGAGHLTERIDPALVNQGLDEVAQIADAVQRAPAAR